jgi:RecA-family ATPase
MRDDARPAEWLVEGVLERGQMAVLVGHRGLGKTFLTIDLAAHVAAGRPWFGCNVTQGRVLYLSAEGAKGFMRRARVFSDNVFQIPRGNFTAHLGVLALGHGKAFGVAQAARDLRRVQHLVARERPELVVIDTVSRYKGDVEENSNSEVATFLAEVQKLIGQTFGCTVLMVTHTPKDQSETARGAGAWENNTDAAMFLRENLEGRYLELDVSRVRDDEALGVLPFRRVNAESSDGAMRSQVIEPLNRAQVDDVHERAAEARVDQTLEALRAIGHPATPHRVWESMKDDRTVPWSRGKPGKAAVLDAFKELEERGRVQCVRQPKRDRPGEYLPVEGAGFEPLPPTG